MSMAFTPTLSSPNLSACYSVYVFVYVFLCVSVCVSLSVYVWVCVRRQGVQSTTQDQEGAYHPFN